MVWNLPESAGIRNIVVRRSRRVYDLATSKLRRHEDYPRYSAEARALIGRGGA